MNIRPAKISDEPQIVALLKSSLGVWQKDWRDNVVQVALKSAGDLALVAEKNKKVIGFASFHDCGFRAYLSEMIVIETEQGKGIGKRLLQEGESILFARGSHLVIADIFPPAVEFYEKQGWCVPSSVLRSKRILGQPVAGGDAAR